MTPAEGLVLGGRYTLVRRIAIGGMGEVWVANDGALHREVAVKVLRSEYAGNEDFLARLRTEARNSAALSHPNIAQMYDYGEQQQSGYLVMELVIGEPMADLLEREPVIALPRLLPILAQTARGLHAAHVAGVVHRDIKPGNILLDKSGEVKITDFGVSLAANQVPMTATGMVMGTAQYLSPEQAIGQAATGASDVYALGIVAYESVAGRRPFTGKTPVDIAVAHVNEAVPPLPAAVHRDLAALIMKMLEKDPTERPRTAAAVGQALDELTQRVADDPWGRRSRRGSVGAHAVAGMAGQASDVGPHPTTDPAPQLTSIPIPAALRSPRHAVEPDGTGFGDAAAVVADAPPPPPAPAATDVVVPEESGPPAPWRRPDDRPAPAAQRTRARAKAPEKSAEKTPSIPPRPKSSASEGEADSPSYPTRRDVHHSTRRPPSTPSRSSRREPVRTSTTTGQRFRLGSGLLSWPLLALIGILVVLVLATVLTGGGADDDAARFTPPDDLVSDVGIVTVSLPGHAVSPLDSGMMHTVAERQTTLCPETTLKDV
ncbi:serine/threonine-protein kinase [Paraoerskovia marina]|uniref:serine/threonine-protein kinase n=1 Tax=Paraoerskovia marina TaxID=545619 RepID=UPI000693BF81|nr:serine/threonine-protein kinase [Paraoerskovia marina]